ncbi:MAG: hypothetical protein CMP45_07975 [Rickettsiales bacterium]|nr:hypothetical protein [Rickettsiales bacterium]|tara:strand:+ start:5252 stop:5890 length:639 start_codon:yes stop_codon:yes gene_type:complete
MDKMTKIILASAIAITLVGVVFIMGLVMKLSTATTENSNLVKQITDQNSSIKDNNAEVEKQMQAALSKQKIENDLRIEELRKEMKVASDAASADLQAVKAERAQLTETIAAKLEKKEDELTPLQKKIREAPAIAKVVAVKEALGFVVIDAGSAKGIEKGSRFNIRRDKFIVAEVEIDEVVDSTNSIGNIDIDKKPPGINIREGDEIIGYPIF